MIKFISNQTSLMEDLVETTKIKQGTIQEVYDYFHHRKQVEVDTETQGFDPYIDDVLTLQVGDYYRQFVIDVTTVDIQKLKPLFQSNRLFLLQNAKFDL